MIRRAFLSLALAVSLAACQAIGGAAPKTPEQTVFSAHVAYSVALAAVEVYADLPACSDTQPAPCRSPEVAQTILKADDAAKASLDLAQETARTPGLSDLIKAETAQRALEVVNTYEALLTDLGVIKAGG